MKVNFSEAGVTRRGDWIKGHLGNWNPTETLTLVLHLTSKKNLENRNWDTTTKEVIFISY